MRVVFAGTPEFAVPCFEAVRAAGVELVAVYTQPDRPAGRGRTLEPSPIKRAALAAGIEVRQPASLKPTEEHAVLAALDPDLMVVVAYGLLLPKAVLAIPRHGCWNVHASLLPRWRGAAPIQRAIEAGDTETGVCLMQMEAGLDTGPVLLRRALPIAADETGGSLHDKLARLGADVLAEGLTRLRSGTLPPPVPQAEVGVTYARKLSKEEARLDFARPAVELERQVRAFLPWPVAEAELAGERVRIHAARALDGDPEAAAGRVVRADAAGVEIACGRGRLRLLRLQRPGGRVLDAGAYVHGRPDLRR